MVGIFSSWLGSLSVGRKLVLICLLNLPVVIHVSGMLIHEKSLSIEFTRKEIVGVAYMDVVRQDLMGVFAPTPSARASGPGERLSFQAARAQHDPVLGTADFAQQYQQAREDLLIGTPDGEAQKARLVAQGRKLLMTVSTQSNLVLDPELDSRHAVSLTVLRFPELLAVLNDAARFMNSATPHSPLQGRTAAWFTLAGRLESSMQAMEGDYQQLWQVATPELKERLTASRQGVTEPLARFLALAQAVPTSEAGSPDWATLAPAHAASLQGLDVAWDEGTHALHELLQARMTRLQSRMWLHLGGALLLLCGVLGLVHVVARQIARPLQNLTRVVHRVRRTADYSHRANWSSQDEIGQLATAFNDILDQMDRDHLMQQELAASARAAAAQQELVESFPIPMVVTSVPDHEVLHANGPAQAWLQGRQQDPWRLGLDSGVRARFFQRLADNGAVDEFEVHWLSGTAPSWAVLSARRIKYQGRDAVLTAFTPINELKIMEQRLELWAKVFEASSESIVIMGADRHIVSVNKAFCRSTSYEFHEVIGEQLAFLIEGPGPQWSALSDKNAWQGEVRMRRQSGETYPAWLMLSVVRDSSEGQVANYIGISIDITDRKANEERIRFLAQHDVLTELPNRSLCQQRLSEALQEARITGEQVAVLFLDLDRFKLVNDTLGHHTGDALLRKVAARLGKAIRAGDTVSRLGGDEFVVIMRHVVSRDEVDAVLNQRLIPSIRSSMTVNEHVLNVSCSVGVALFPVDATDPYELMRRADAAMYEAKSAGRDMARHFSQETDQRVLARQIMEAQLRKALGNSEFSLHFQPRLHARTRKLAGAEALLRWHNAVLGQVPPGDFIELAEETGLIKPIGLWVLTQACRQWRAFEAYGLPTGLQLSVNLSAAQLADAQLVVQVQEVLESVGMPAEQLELELTESHLMDNPAAAQAQVSALKKLGVHVAIDDFGTGYSSLTYLKRFEIDKLKIDQSFVLGMLDDTADAAIVQAVIALGHTLGLKVVAEGVETLPTAQTLTALGCDELQGYGFSRPLPVSDFMNWVGEHSPTPERRRTK